MAPRRASDGTPLVSSPAELVPGQLTARQRQVVGMFISGWTYKQIASQLGLHPETINPTLKQAARRIGCDGIAREKLRVAAAEQIEEYELP